jgi:hypothetical protein
MCISNGGDCSNIKACSSHQLYRGLIMNSSEARHYSYTERYGQAYEPYEPQKTYENQDNKD